MDVTKFCYQSFVFAFNISFAKEVTAFLLKYQTEKPVLPFLAKDLFGLIKYIMTRFIKADVMSKATSVTKLMSIDVNDKKNHLHYSNIDIGFTTERLISQLTSGSRRTISE